MFKKLICTLILLILTYSAYAQNKDTPKNDWLDKITSFITAYRPTYILPYHYNSKIPTARPPDGGNVSHTEMKFQISIKGNLLPNILNTNTSFYVAYSQLSFWQQYSKKGFVRENNYEPELFLTHNFSEKWRQKGILSTTFGYDHDSNGEGGKYERSWERLYLDFRFGTKNLIFSVKPWLRISGVLEHHNYNDNITKYLGHGRFLFAYKFRNNVFSIMSRNNLESLFKRGAVEITWGFPIYKQLRGFADFFCGYGQSLNEYNHYNNSFGVGLALSDWL